MEGSHRPMSDPPATAEERKRHRDKINQRRKREKEQAHVRSLEARVHDLERTLAKARLDPGIAALDQKLADDLILVSASRLRRLLDRDASPRQTPLNTPLPNDEDLLRFFPFDGILERIRNGSLVGLPDRPKAADIMHGKSANELANLIAHQRKGFGITLFPERYGSAYVTYLYVHWLANPTETAERNLPEYYRPTALQLTRPHSPVIDLFMWPQLRDNMIIHESKHDLLKVLASLACHFRVIAPRDKLFVVDQADGSVDFTPAALDSFMELESWMLLERFWQEFPDLVQGFDRKFMLREPDLAKLDVAWTTGPLKSTTKSPSDSV